MASTGARRRPQKCPDELRERAVKMVFEVREPTGERQGAVTRVAKELGIGAESIDAAPSIGTIGDSFDNAMAESVIG